MKYYRNVKVKDDPTVNRKEEDEFDELDVRGGFEFPASKDVPLIESADEDEVEEIELEEEGEFELDEEEVFEIEAPIDLDDDDDDF